ncbi:ATP-binding cassette domain-containing protein [Adlercreutzia caecimuris]|jgi:ABC-2 type transport system ATP-binding protein|uniref:ATP-binding cassette domain-containing protein n=1 Tax=Adlercreutzia caecimuris TaxID=671266 RepID=UPI002570DBCD|nr:ATP-binding cassette domain-containing protein [Adlercreutzia caecimuris]
MIELLNVCKFIKGREVLRDVSLSIESGEVVGIKGANGSGKTMLLRAIAGLIYPTSGSVVVDGVNPRESAAFPPSIGLLIENPSFFASPHWTEKLRTSRLDQRRCSEEANFPVSHGRGP